MTAAEAIVCIVDDEEAVRSAITDLLESAGLTARAYSSGREFLEAQAQQPAAGCLILDIRLVGASGLQFQEELAAAGSDLPIIFITGHGDIPMTVQAMKAGAVDFLTKPFRDQELLDAIGRAMERSRVARAKQAGMLDVQRRFGELTPREREVMLLVVRGLLNKQIASELGMSETTVKVHRGQVMRKMQADSLPDLVRMADRLSTGQE